MSNSTVDACCQLCAASCFVELLQSYCSHQWPTYEWKVQKEARNNAAKQPPALLGRSWGLAFAFSAFIALFSIVFGFGFGAWASILSFKQNSNQYGAFAGESRP